MDKNIKQIIKTLVQEEMNNMLTPTEPDHEAKMAKGELRDMIMNANKLYKMMSIKLPELRLNNNGIINIDEIFNCKNARYLNKCDIKFNIINFIQFQKLID
jgi:Leucine-rich repeat (LRR) protein